MRVVFAGGGTGGHLYPALAVAEELSARHAGFEALFVGTSRGIESRVIPGSAYSLEVISSRGARGKGLAGKVVTGAMLTAGIMQSMGIIRRFSPDLVFGSGGYASVAAVTAAWLMRKTVVLQEQNSIPGLANRTLAPTAKRLYLGFEKARGYFKKNAPVIVTGNPLRGAIEAGPGSGARADFGLNEKGRVLLVFGGSQGAMTLSRAAAGYLLRRTDIQAIVQTGDKGYEEIRDLLAVAAGRVFVSPYIEDIGKAYAAADVALARAGALSVSELAAAGLPSVLVPYPHCADDHQTHNASVLVDAGGALMIEDSRLDADSLSAKLDPVIDEPGLLEGMRGALVPFQGMRAAAVIADDMEKLAGGEAR
ncbi:MAG: undecaprenyldiphospho-muramoylpentapeptide beta-N-acetylglucosaminyltransferase [Candidatus Krumholzibacteria bacterium]|nr:undecaprenyldiphospho-muramoylpentapeptide beta-N-acetylglucosaminyltransferase [Candidatus Krumholzibacteria bacterium]